TKTRKRRKYNRVRNVKADVNGYTKTFKKQRVTKQQQRKINRAFKEGVSPYVIQDEFNYLDTKPGSTNAVKWVWECNATFRNLCDAWQMTNVTDNQQASGNNNSFGPSVQYSQMTENNALYFSQHQYKYEIYNPTNYDMNLVIYDIICKEETPGSVERGGWDKRSTIQNELSSTDYFTPVNLMCRGNDGIADVVPGTGYTGDLAIVTDSSSRTGTDVFDIQMKPTDSYPFNVYWKVVKKRILRLQPGATHTHVFTYRPKMLLKRGYWAWKYKKHFKNISNTMANAGIPGFTCGTLFKFWGQVS
ncbi:hypothetical protein BCR36DRAFT_243027, partial [Piromyces finnis]